MSLTRPDDKSKEQKEKEDRERLLEWMRYYVGQRNLPPRIYPVEEGPEALVDKNKPTGGPSIGGTGPSFDLLKNGHYRFSDLKEPPYTFVLGDDKCYPIPHPITNNAFKACYERMVELLVRGKGCRGFVVDLPEKPQSKEEIERYVDRLKILLEIAKGPPVLTMRLSETTQEILRGINKTEENLVDAQGKPLYFDSKGNPITKMDTREYIYKEMEKLRLNQKVDNNYLQTADKRMINDLKKDNDLANTSGIPYYRAANYSAYPNDYDKQNAYLNAHHATLQTPLMNKIDAIAASGKTKFDGLSEEVEKLEQRTNRFERIYDDLADRLESYKKSLDAGNMSAQQIYDALYDPNATGADAKHVQELIKTLHDSYYDIRLEQRQYQALLDDASILGGVSMRDKMTELRRKAPLSSDESDLLRKLQGVERKLKAIDDKLSLPNPALPPLPNAKVFNVDNLGMQYKMLDTEVKNKIGLTGPRAKL